MRRGSVVTVGVSVSARVITTADVGVGVTAGNVFARLVLNSRSQVNVRTVAKKIAVGGVGVGHAHGDLVTHRTRGHIGRSGRRCITSSVIVAIKRLGIVRIRSSKLIFIVAERHIRNFIRQLHIILVFSGVEHQRRQITDRFVSARLDVNARGINLQTGFRVAEEDTLAVFALKIVAVEQDVRKLEHTPTITAKTTRVAVIVWILKHVVFNHRVHNAECWRAPKRTIDAACIRAAKGHTAHHHVITDDRRRPRDIAGYAARDLTRLKIDIAYLARIELEFATTRYIACDTADVFKLCRTRFRLAEYLLIVRVARYRQVVGTYAVLGPTNKTANTTRCASFFRNG